MDRVWQFIDVVAARPFASAVIAFAIFFLASLFVFFGVMHARWIWRMPIVRLPPPEDRAGIEAPNPPNAMNGIVLFILLAIVLLAIWTSSGNMR